MDTLILNKDGTPLSMMPLSVVRWETAIRLLTLDKVHVMKDHDDWVVRSPSTTMNVPSVVICTEYVKWNRHIKYNRNNVLLRDDYTCQYCLKRFGVSTLTIDHVVPRSHGGKTSWKNVVAACKDCNSRKGNNKDIVPKKMPHRPSYYELVAKSRTRTLRIRDEYWLSFIDWPEDKIDLVPYKRK
jgi:5-methylcytosine-specific restriction endonuclease McrA